MDFADLQLPEGCLNFGQRRACLRGCILRDGIRACSRGRSHLRRAIEKATFDFRASNSASGSSPAAATAGVAEVLPTEAASRSPVRPSFSALSALAGEETCRARRRAGQDDHGGLACGLLDRSAGFQSFVHGPGQACGMSWHVMDWIATECEKAKKVGIRKRTSWRT